MACPGAARKGSDARAVVDSIAVRFDTSGMASFISASGGWAALREAGLNAVLPPRCLGCGTMVAAVGSLCAACWEAVDFLGPPQCASCGMPFAYDLGADALCGRCASRPPAFDRVRAVMRYGDVARHLVLNFKHGDRTDGAPAFSSWLVRAGRTLLAEADVLAPIPLHWRRLFSRRYNQAALLSAQVARLAGRPHCPDLLLRTRHTPSQGRLSPGQRRRNLRGAFAVNPRREATVAGQRVLLIDDVMTTGATISACAEALRRAGADGVDALVLAQVVRPSVS